MDVATQSGSNAYTAPVSNQIMPAGQMVKALPVRFQLSANVAQELNLEIPYSKRVIDQIQSVYIDNRNNGRPFILTCQNTRQVISAPAYSQGWYPVLVGNPPAFSAICADTVDVECVFINVPMPVGNWNATTLNFGGATGVSCADYSATFTGNTLALAANTARKYILIVCNTADISINFVAADATPGTVGTVDMVSGQIWESGLSVPLGDVYIYTAAATLVTVIEGV